jgi:hypothetical protein
MAQIVLFRPVGEVELALVRESGWTAFPPRLPEQPIFYPVLEEEYAIQIARDWNARDGNSGYVLRFEVSGEYLARYSVHTVGSQIHQNTGYLPRTYPNLTGILLGQSQSYTSLKVKKMPTKLRPL